jgi:segregation and condensation protein B
MEEQEIKAAMEQPEAEVLPVDEQATPVEASEGAQPEAVVEQQLESEAETSAEPAPEQPDQPAEAVVEEPVTEEPTEPAAAAGGETPAETAAEAPAEPSPEAAEETTPGVAEPGDNPLAEDDEVFEAVFELEADARESVSAEQLLGEQTQPAGEEDSARAELKAVLEAIVYVLNEPMPAIQIAAALGRDIREVEPVLQLLAEETSRGDRGIFIREVAGGYQMATKPEHHDVLRTFVKNLKQPLKLSQAALETLAVIAYKQPITMPEILEIRGVQGGGVVKTLIDRKLITTAGRKNVIGKPMLYKTTKEFLTQFGLKDVNELPSLKEFEEIRRQSIADDDIVGTAQQPLLPASEEAETPEPAPETVEAVEEAVVAEEPAAEPAAEPQPAAETQPAVEAEAEAPPAGEQEKTDSPDA